MKTFILPVNQISAVLHELINTEGISERDMPFNGFRSRISDLNKSIKIDYKEESFVNQFGRKSSYRRHFLQPSQIEGAKILFTKINKKTNK